MSTTRRTIMQGLVALPVALVTPAAAERCRAAPKADAALIAHAQRVVALSRAEMAACLRVGEACGARNATARRVQARAERRLVEAAGRLTRMAPVTRQGLTSKATAAVAICDTYVDSAHPEWLTDLAEATLRDVLAIGGAA